MGSHYATISCAGHYASSRGRSFSRHGCRAARNHFLGDAEYRVPDDFARRQARNAPLDFRKCGIAWANPSSRRLLLKCVRHRVASHDPPKKARTRMYALPVSGEMISIVQRILDKCRLWIPVFVSEGIRADDCLFGATHLP